MVNVLDVFAEMHRVLIARGYALEDEKYDAESFGHRSRTYRKDPKNALSLLWDARDYWFIIQGGNPWRDLAIYRNARRSTDPADVIVGTLLEEVDAAG